jgi:hypothetical protein
VSLNAAVIEHSNEGVPLQNGLVMNSPRSFPVEVKVG